MKETPAFAVGQMEDGDRVVSDDGEIENLDFLQRDPLRHAGCDPTPFGGCALADREPYEEDDEEDPS